MKKVYERLLEHLASMTPEQKAADWEELKKYNDIGTSMKRFNLSEFLSDPSRKVVTREGLPVRIICTDADRPYPVIALMKKSGYEHIERYTPDGTWVDDKRSDMELFFAPIKRKAWVNLYAHPVAGLYTGLTIFNTKEEAEKCDSLFTATIEWEES